MVKEMNDKNLIPIARGTRYRKEVETEIKNADVIINGKGYIAPEEKIKVFELKIQGSSTKIVGCTSSGIAGAIEVEIDKLQNNDGNVLRIEVRHKEISLTEYEKFPELFDGY